MKKIDEAVKRFGAPDYGRTAKRLRHFEAELIGAGKIDVNSVRRGDWCCERMTVSGWCEVHSSEPCPTAAMDLLNKQDLHFAMSKNVTDSAERNFGVRSNVDVLRAEIEALQQLLNEKDYEIDMLRNIKPKDLWFTAGLVGLVALGAYLGFM